MSTSSCSTCNCCQPLNSPGPGCPGCAKVPASGASSSLISASSLAVATGSGVWALKRNRNLSRWPVKASRPGALQFRQQGRFARPHCAPRMRTQPVGWRPMQCKSVVERSTSGQRRIVLPTRMSALRCALVGQAVCPGCTCAMAPVSPTRWPPSGLRSMPVVSWCRSIVISLPGWRTA